MNFFKNKHVITAMIVAPILALIAYFTVDLVVKEKPHVAVQGQAYPLVAKSNCRFSSGECTLENASFSSRLSVDADTNSLKLTSSHSLQSVTIGFVDAAGSEISPANMVALGSSSKAWQFELPDSINRDAVARLAIKANDAFYFAETEMQFSTYETLFDKDFRKNSESLTIN